MTEPAGVTWSLLFPPGLNGPALGYSVSTGRGSSGSRSKSRALIVV
jgi:hypothetical protein